MPLFLVNKIKFIQFVICELQYFSVMLPEFLIGMNQNFLYLCSSAKISVAKIFKSRHLQKSVSAKNFQI